ncbi:PGBM protein, partial [Heliornis fulica]|nr:PGBM protein [Heliornis fulica]
CPLPAGVRLSAAAVAGDSGRLGRVRVPGDHRCHQQGNCRHGDNPTQRCRCPGSTTPLRIESPSSAVAEGQTLDLNCVIASPAQATVTWYKRGGSLPAKHQVGDMEGGRPQWGWLGLSHGSIQAQVAHAKVRWPHGSGPMEALMAPVPPCPLPAGVRLSAAA